jgi:hypothetical protein
MMHQPFFTLSKKFHSFYHIRNSLQKIIILLRYE